MLRNYIFFILLYFSFVKLSPAIDLYLANNDSAKATTCLSGVYATQSNSLSNTFIRDFFILPKFITPEMKDEASLKIKSKNQFGLTLSYGISHFQRTKRKDIGFYFSASHKEYFNTSFTGDMFRLLMYGNKMFENDTANLDELSINFLRYQKISAGIIWTSVDTVAKLGFAISYLNGESNYMLNAPKARLFTSINGQYLNFETNMRLSMSDTTNKQRYANNGTGFSADMFFEAPFKLKRRNGKVVVSAQDIGFIQWNKKAVEYSVDSSFYFDGVEVNDVFELRDSIFSSMSSDSLLNKITNKSSKRISTIIPAMLDVYSITYYGNKFQFIKGVNHLFNANYKPLFYAKGNILAARNLWISVGASYGGYTGFSANLGVDKTFGKTLNVKIYCSNIEGIIMPDKTYAQGVYFTLTKLFF